MIAFVLLSAMLLLASTPSSDACYYCRSYGYGYGSYYPSYYGSYGSYGYPSYGYSNYGYGYSPYSYYGKK
jgi:hypothetical protein